MSEQPGPNQGIVGYVSAELGRRPVWHLDANCAGRDQRAAAYTSGPSTAGADAQGGRTPPAGFATVLDLAHWQGTRGRYPCLTCATLPVLDALAANPAGPGYHAVACGYPHTGNGPCTQCTTLARYATDRDLLSATSYGRVWLLTAGNINEELATLLGASLRVQVASGLGLPTMTKSSWGSAAALLAVGVKLKPALEAASALHAPPGQT